MAPVNEGLAAPIESARGLGGAAYTDEAVFRREVARIFTPTWTCVGFDGDIPDAGDMMPVNLAGTPLLLARDQDGEIRAFHNVCRHRGTVLVDGPRKRTLRVVCPYHNWTYGLDGSLKGTPNFDGPGRDWGRSAFDRADLGLRPVRLERWHRWLFVNLDGKAPPLADHMAPYAHHFEGYDFDAVRIGSMVDFTIPANWKLMVENFLDTYHVGAVHRSLNDLYTVIADRAGSKRVVDPFFSVAITVPEGFSTAAWNLPMLPGLSPIWRNRHEYIYLFPNVILFLLPNHLVSIVELPDAPGRCRQRWHVGFAEAALSGGSHTAARDALVAFWRQVNEEDIRVCESLQQGKQSPANEGDVFSAYWDDLVFAFQRKVDGLLAGPAA